MHSHFPVAIVYQIHIYAAKIEAAEKEEKLQQDTLRAREEKIKRELEKKMREDREDKMEYWVSIVIVIFKPVYLTNHV